MAKSALTISRRRMLSSALALAGLPAAGARRRSATKSSFWNFYDTMLARAKYIDLTHALAPGCPLGEGFKDFTVSTAVAGVTVPGLVRKGQPFTYATEGAAITAYKFPMDHIGTQYGPPAHLNDHGATISDIPPTVSLRPLVVINCAPQVTADPGYQAKIRDVESWEQRHGRIPAGAVVMFRSDWYKQWNRPHRFTRQPFPGVELATLKFLHLKRHILMHGHEPLDTDNTAPKFVAETWLLKHNYAQAEGVANLDQVPESGALVTIGFAKFSGGTGGFARYIAIAPPEWPYGVTLAEQSGAPLPTHKHRLRRGPDGVLS